MNSAKHPWLNDLPDMRSIFREALKRLGLDKDKIREMRPYEVANKLEEMCHKIYSEYEETVRQKFIKGMYGRYDVREFETSLANARRQRGGKTLETIFEELLKLYGIPYDSGKIYEAEFDFIIPSRDTAMRNPRKAVLILVKREVRERWRLTVGDAYILRRIYNFPEELDNIWFISLFDPPIDAVTSMVKLNIRIYVPNGSFNRIVEEVRSRVTENELSRIKRFSEIFEDLQGFSAANLLSWMK